MANVGEVAVGDKVTTNAEYDWNGTHLASFVRTTTYDVIQVGAESKDKDRYIVIGLGSEVTAGVDIATLNVVQKKDGSPVTNKTDTKKDETFESLDYREQVLISKGIEDAMIKMLKESIPSEYAKYSMRIFGIPHQFTKYCDYRTFVTPEHKYGEQYVGRKFMENIMMEAPVITFVPGKPKYLSNAKDKRTTTIALLEKANSGLEKAGLTDTKLHEKLRYYDFQQDYTTYMSYVNILCNTAAKFLDIGDKTFRGAKLGSFKWENYRWTEENYKRAAQNVLFNNPLDSLVDLVKAGFVSQQNKITDYASAVQNSISSIITGKTPSNTDMSEDTSESLSILESNLQQYNFVQFYVTPESGVGESASNATGESKVAQTVNSAEDFANEIAFLVNSGGADYEKLQSAANDSIDELTATLTDGTGVMGGLLERLGSSFSNVIKGDIMIFPEIYMNSKYTKNYSITIDLRTPYGNKLSYFLNVLVPLFHILGFTIPKQSTANTYAAPFLVRAYYPGMFSCNLGIIESVNIEKNPNGTDSMTIDGYPAEMRVTLNLIDLYSDLNLTPAGDFVLFISNSSLIEFIATNCGINLVTPQLQNRVKYVMAALESSVQQIPETIVSKVFEGFENFISGLLYL